MEQYQMPKRLDFRNLRRCLDNHEAESIFIRLKGSSGGTVKVRESLESRKLDFCIDEDWIYLSIDSKPIFKFTMADHASRYTKGFSLAYERFEIVNNTERLVCLSTGIDPYDPSLPEPKRSFLRHALDDHLLEIYFKGRIPLKFHSWWIKPHWKYWKVA